MSDLANRTEGLSLEESASMTPTTRSQGHVSTTGIRYNLQELDERSQARAASGLQAGSRISVEFCREVQEGRYGFQLTGQDGRRASVRIGNDDSAPRCTCNANKTGLSCDHIYWLLDQILAATRRRPEVCVITRNGASISGKTPFELIAATGFTTLARNRGWLIPGVTDVEQGDEGESGEETEGSEDEDEESDGARAERELNDILSVFDPSGALPDEMMASDAHQTLGERSQVYARFGSIIKGHAARDRGLLNQLRATVKPDFRARVYFEKVQVRAREAFEGLNEYITRGPASQQRSYDVVRCAQVLIRMTEAVGKGIEERVRPTPTAEMMATLHVAVSALVFILRGVADRDFDLHARVTWNRATPQNEPLSCRNLYELLVRTDRRSRERMSLSSTSGLFVVEQLRRIPPVVLKDHTEQLNSVLSQIEAKGAPEEFIEALRNIMPDNRKRAASDAPGSSSKKAAK